MQVMAQFNAGKYRLPLGQKTYVMAILNITPDSFSDGGLYNDADIAVSRAIHIQRAGADIIDIGAQSTRPGYKRISQQEEWERLKPVLSRIREAVDIPISIDTFYPYVAQKALDLGADIINDVTGFKDEKMFDIASKSDCGCIIMHDMPGIDIKTFFEERLKFAEKYGISKDRICFDPGVGFGKTYEENLYILKHVDKMKADGCAMLIGASRKRVIGKPCGDPPFDKRMAGTLAAHTIAITGGADIIRVHDVEESIQAAKVADAITNISL